MIASCKRPICQQTISLWLRYVDDTFITVHKYETDAFYDHLDEQNTDIQFTRQVKEDGIRTFLDCLVSRDEKKLRTNYEKNLQKTDAYRQSYRRIILQPNIKQSYDYQDSNETNAISLQHTRKLVRRKQIPRTCSFVIEVLCSERMSARLRVLNNKLS